MSIILPAAATLAAKFSTPLQSSEMKYNDLYLIFPGSNALSVFDSSRTVCFNKNHSEAESFQELRNITFNQEKGTYFGEQT